MPGSQAGKHSILRRFRAIAKKRVKVGGYIREPKQKKVKVKGYYRTITVQFAYLNRRFNLIGWVKGHKRKGGGYVDGHYSKASKKAKPK